MKNGGEPMNVFRDPTKNIRLEPPVPDQGQVQERGQYYRGNYHKVAAGGSSYMDDDVDRYCPDRELLQGLYRRAEEVEKKKIAVA